MSTNDALNKGIDLLTQVVQAAKEAVTAYGPDAWSLTLKIVQVDGYQHLALTVSFALMAAILLFVSRYLWVWGTKGDRYSGQRDAGGSFSVISSVIAGFLLVAFGISLIDIWAWMAIFHPDLYLAHLAVEKILSVK